MTPQARAVPVPLPTRRAAAVVAACAPLVAAGALHPAFAIAGLAAAAAALLLTAADWLALPGASDLEVRRVPRPALPLRSPAELEIEVRLGASARGPALARVADDLEQRLERLADPAPVRLEPGEWRRFATRVSALHRGRARLGAVDVRLRSRLGLAERQVRCPAEGEVRVYPGLRGIASVGRLRRRSAREEAGLRRARQPGEGTSFESLHEHVPGEDPRRIDWKATARHARLIARRYEVERSQAVLLLVDCGRWMTAEVEGATRLDHALDAALLVAAVAARRDDRVGVLAFSDRIEAFVPPAKGRGAVERVLQAVYELEPRYVESDYARAFTYLGARHRKRSLLVLFTDVLGRETSRALVEQCVRSARRHLPLAVTVRDPSIDAIADAVPLSRSAAYQQAAADELLLEREQALAVLRAAGIQVLDRGPRGLGAAVVDRYVELKSRLLV